MIDQNAVHELFLSCLFKDEELTNGVPNVEYVATHGVVNKVGLHKDRALSSRKQVADWLLQLSNTFYVSGGGGYSFVEMCYQIDGVLWTGSQRVMDELLCLAIANNLASVVLRELAAIMTGGMPYVIIDDVMCSKLLEETCLS